MSDEQLDAMARISTGQLGGMPWAIRGTTFEVAGVVRAEVALDHDGTSSGFSGAASGSEEP